MTLLGQEETTRWIWMDLEMTGLDVERCVILQIATVITDASLREVESLDIVVQQPEEAFEQMIPFVRQMHTKNGLLERVRASRRSLAEAEARTLQLISRYVRQDEGILVGNSIWMDRLFLRRHMPRLETYLHHRQIDVSSLKVLCQTWYGERGTAPDKESQHTALEDVRDSIAELRFYRERCFRQP